MPRLRDGALSLLALNLPFLLARPAAPLLTDPLFRSLAINLALFVAPGLPLAGLLLRRRRSSPPRFLRVIACSTGVWLAATAALIALGGPPDAGRTWTAAWLATNAAWALNRVLGGAGLQSFLPGRRALAGGLVLFAAAYAAYFHAATRVVPPMEDHDYETQGTGHGLLTSLRPALLTDRGTELYFAHPPLLHLYVAWSFAGWDRLDRLAAYEPLPGEKDPARLYALYRRDPAPLPTRTPNLFLAALTVALLGAFASRLSGRAWLGTLATAAYASSPEAFVRSSYGGYFAAGQFAALSILLADEDGDALLAGAFAALVDHKLVLLPLALAGWRLHRARREGTPARLHPAAAGFALGTALFWAYGLAIDAGAFWQDHARTHLVDRLAHHNPLGYGGYPGPAALWLEFWRHTGYLLLPLGAATLAALPGLSAWRAWAAMTAVVFTAVDWRQTKHLTPLLLPLTLAPAAWAATGRRALAVVALALLALLAWNVREAATLARGFPAYPVTPAW